MNIRSEETFTIYRSSAGSGKTHQLAVEFVSLAIGDPSLFNKILAVTFTNKATKEMKERILHFFVTLSKMGDIELLEHLKGKTGLSDDVIAENSKLVIGKILHQYSQFSISTIDAFFQKIVKSFAKELGLLGNFKVELDQDKIKQEIIDQIIGELGENEQLTDWLVDFSFSKVDENKSWNIRPQIEPLTDEVFKEAFKLVEKELSAVKGEDLKAFLDQVRKIKKTFEENMRSKAGKAKELIDAYGLLIDDFLYKTGGPAGYFDRILNRQEFEPKSRVEEAIADPDKWYSKSSPKKHQILQAVEGGLQKLTTSMVDYYQRNIQEYTTATEALKNLHVFGILSQIIKKLKAYRQENDVMLISDVPVFLKGIIAENEAPFIYEKTGTWYQHYLIDEFQDTSGFQWNNFKPLVENGQSQELKSMLVGDGKQSIYRWRGGDWNLILNQVKEDLHTWNPAEKHLNTNWRSARKIIEFNNEVFGYLPSLIRSEVKSKIDKLALPEPEKDLLLAMSSDIEKLYEDVTQKVAPKNLEPSRGMIEVNAYQKDSDSPWKERALNELPKLIERLQDAGYKPKDIAVLVRRSDEGKQVIERLIQYKKSIDFDKGYCYDAISNESLFLGNSPVIRLLISAIKYGLDPDDRISLGELGYTYGKLNGTGNNGSEQENLQFIFDGGILPKAFFDEADALLRLPVYEMVERIIRLFDLERHQYKGYLQAFQDVVLEYFSGESRDINDFLGWWDEEGKRRSIQIPESVNAIRVMTIHKSKGLEFKAVLVPFCDWKLDHDATKVNFLWCKTDKKPFDKIGYLPVKYNSRLGNSFFARKYVEEMIKAHIDNLNLLYVALTRAEEFLLINCPPQSKEVKNAGDLVLKTIEKMTDDQIGDVNTVDNDEGVSVKKYTIGVLEKNQMEINSENGSTTNPEYESADWRERIAIRKKGGEYFGPDALERKGKINYGLLVHEILAQIKNEKEADFLIDKYYTQGQISHEDRGVLVDQLDRIFSNPQVQAWFNTDWEVKSEVSIIRRNGRPRRPDRVLLCEEKAVIIDFKTGMEKPADKRQVLEYLELLNEMGYQKTEAYLLYIAPNKVVKIA